MEKKKIYEILGSLFIAAIMIGSFAAYGGNATSPQPPSASQNAANNSTPFWHATNITVARIDGYNNFFYFAIECANSNATPVVLNKTYSTLGRMNLTATEIGNRIDVLSSSPITAYEYLSGNITKAEAECISIYANAEVNLPKRLIFHLNYIYNPNVNTTISFPVPAQEELQQVPLIINSSNFNQSSMNIRITSLLTQNFTLYGNMSISKI